MPGMDQMAITLLLYLINHLLIVLVLLVTHFTDGAPKINSLKYMYIIYLLSKNVTLFFQFCIVQSLYSH